MEILMSVIAGVLFMAGTYLLLTKSILRVVMAVVLLSHGAHLLLLTMPGLTRGSAPLLDLDATSFSDPLPQAMILTAIVISFGITAFMIVLAYRTYKEHNTDDLEELRGSADE